MVPGAEAPSISTWVVPVGVVPARQPSVSV